MKVGILTLVASDNCGSLLQTYALQHVLSDRYGHKVEVINFVNEESRNLYSIFPKPLSKYKRKTVYGIIHFDELRKQKKNYQLFREQFISLTNEVYRNEQELAIISDRYDVVITGSDQVWNLQMPDSDKAYYLNWVNNRKIAYAPSFGNYDFTMSQGDIKFVKKSLTEFEGVSTREHISAMRLKESGGIDATVLADPTLLVSRSEWSQMAGGRQIKEDYIFFYSWSYGNDCLNEKVSEFSNKTSLPVYVINPSKWYIYRPQKFGYKLYKQSGPSAFLNLMKYAKYVFVESFHGMVFANIYQKDYWLLDSNDEGHMDNRLHEAVVLFGAEDYVIRKSDDLKRDLSIHRDYSHKTEKMEQLVQKSLDYLNHYFG